MSARKYTLDDIWHLVVAHRWLLLIPIAIGLAAAPILAGIMPLRYRSDALILVQKPQVSDSYVPQPAAREELERRLPSITTRILSRNQLEQIILEMDLYKDERKREVMEDVVEKMRLRDVVTAPTGRGSDSFRVSYVSDDPATAQKVTERLARLYISENALDRANQAQSTSELLSAEIDTVKQRLSEQDKRLEAYRRAHAGQLPTQMQGNLAALNSLNMQLQSLSDRTNQTIQRRMFAERELANLEAVPLPSSPSPAAGSTTVSTAELLEAARAERERLLQRLTPQHPAVADIERTIVELSERLANEAPLSARTSAPQRSITLAEAERQRKRLDIQAQLDVLDEALKQDRAEQADIKRQIASYQGRVDVVPTREQELQDLMREYETLSKHYADLLLKKENASLGASVERRSIGERFILLDEASRPERPYNEMQRLGVTFSGAGVGLVLAILFIGLREYRDSSFRSTDEVTNALSLPVLGAIPVMTSAGERSSAARRKFAMDLGGSAVLLASVAIVVAWQLYQ